MKILIHESIPCWYEFGWDAESIAIVLRIHQDFIVRYPRISEDCAYVQVFLKEFGFKEFSGDFAGDIGFEKVFHNNGVKGEFVEFIIPIPVLRKDTGEICKICGGSGDGNHRDEKCICCGGSGNEYCIDWHKGHLISATFTTILPYLLLWSDDETNCSLPQLFTVQTITEVGMHGGSLGGAFGVELVKWFSTFSPPHVINEMVDAMKMAYEQLFAQRPHRFDRFNARIDYENGWLNVDCPGDACGLNPSYGGVNKDGHGYGVGCHNVDTCAQQLTLLAGLAALHDKARKEIK